LYAVVRVLGQPRKLLHEYWAITSSHTYTHKELAPARIKEDIKAVGEQVDQLKDVIRDLAMKRRCSINELVHAEVSKRQLK